MPYGVDYGNWYYKGLTLNYKRLGRQLNRDVERLGTLARKEIELTAGATTTLDWDTFNFFDVSLGTNTTFSFINPRANSDFVIVITKDATGTARNVTWPVGLDWDFWPTVSSLNSASEVVFITIAYYNNVYRVVYSSQGSSLGVSYVANAAGGTWGSRRHTLGTSADLAPLSYYSSVNYPDQIRYVFNIQRHDLVDTAGTSTLDRALQIDMTRALDNETRVWGIGIIGDDSSNGGKPYVGVYSQMSRQIGGNGNNFAGVFELDDYDGQTDSVAVEINAGIPDGTTYTNAALLHLIVGTHDTEAGVGTLPQAIQINTSGVAGNRKEANLTKAIDIREDGTGRITNGIYIATSPGAGLGTGYYDEGTKGRGVYLNGTYDVASIETSGFILKPSLVTVGINNTAWVLRHTDTDRTVELNGGNATNTGGNIRLNGQSHATRPNYVELRVSNTTKVTTTGTETTFADPVKLPSYVVASLPSGSAGLTAFASNGRKNGEGAGAGTGVLVFHDGTAWRACDTGATVAA